VRDRTRAKCFAPRRLFAAGGGNPVHRAQADLQIRELLQPTAFPHSVRSIELRETHVSWVVLTGSYAYKVKKPVKLDFLDASTLSNVVTSAKKSCG
jgi:hypothetical protein